MQTSRVNLPTSSKWSLKKGASTSLSLTFNDVEKFNTSTTGDITVSSISMDSLSNGTTNKIVNSFATAAGDLITHNGASITALAKGATNAVLVASSGQSTGHAWTSAFVDHDSLTSNNGGTGSHATFASHIANTTIHTQMPMTTKGDLWTLNASGTSIRIPVGANNTVLVTDSSQPGGMKWKSPYAYRTISGVKTDVASYTLVSGDANEILVFDNNPTASNKDALYITVPANTFSQAVFIIIINLKPHNRIIKLKPATNAVKIRSAMGHTFLGPYSVLYNTELSNVWYLKTNDGFPQNILQTQSSAPYNSVTLGSNVVGTLPFRCISANGTKIIAVCATNSGATLTAAVINTQTMTVATSTIVSGIGSPTSYDIIKVNSSNIGVAVIAQYANVYFTYYNSTDAGATWTTTYNDTTVYPSTQVGFGMSNLLLCNGYPCFVAYDTNKNVVLNRATAYNGSTWVQTVLWTETATPTTRGYLVLGYNLSKPTVYSCFVPGSNIYSKAATDAAATTWSSSGTAPTTIALDGGAVSSIVPILNTDQSDNIYFMGIPTGASPYIYSTYRDTSSVYVYNNIRYTFFNSTDLVIGSNLVKTMGMIFVVGRKSTEMDSTILYTDRVGGTKSNLNFDIFREYDTVSSAETSPTSQCMCWHKNRLVVLKCADTKNYIKICDNANYII